MNLYDVVRRKDRSLEILAGHVEAVRYDRPYWYYGITLGAATRARLRRADEFSVMGTFPRDFGWSVAGEGRVNIEIVVRSTDGAQAGCLASINGAGPILLTWPHWVGAVDGFDLDLINNDDAPIEIRSGPVFNPRTATSALLKGVGIEVGPGSNPFLKPGPSVDVRYVEALPIEEWLNNYDKQKQVTAEGQELWARYVIGDAQQLDCCDNGSLDFIFSNHVFEHLMNPLGVLRNWSRKLRPTGVVVGVVPDLRYCFDLRQPPSTPADWLEEYETGMWTLTGPKYEKWCRYTAPYNTPEDLISRNYSIHAHYYTPAGFRELAEMAIARGFYRALFLNTSPNNKDFGWVLWKG